MVELHIYHRLPILLLLFALIAKGLVAPTQSRFAAKDNSDDEEDDPKLTDEEYEAWVEEQLDEQLALLESMFDISEALSVADSPLGDLDEDFLDELLKNKLKPGAENHRESEQSLPNNLAQKTEDLEEKQAKVSKTPREDDLEHLLELAVNVLGSMLSKSGDNESSRNIAKRPVHSCLDEKIEMTKCSGDFQRWIVYKNGGFCKLTENGGCQGHWYQEQEPVDCVEICIYAPSAQEKKLSIRLAANSHSINVHHMDRNESAFWA